MISILSIGQCAYDDSRIGRLVKEATGAFLDRAASPDEARAKLAEKKYALILVNRVFDNGTGKGLDLIAALKQSGESAPMMLVSDYPDAQAEAVVLGALAGFGKSALAVPEVGVKIRDAIQGVGESARRQTDVTN